MLRGKVEIVSCAQKFDPKKKKKITTLLGGEISAALQGSICAEEPEFLRLKCFKRCFCLMRYIIKASKIVC